MFMITLIDALPSRKSDEVEERIKNATVKTLVTNFGCETGPCDRSVIVKCTKQFLEACEALRGLGCCFSASGTHIFSYYKD